MHLITWVTREQGLIVPKGNPNEISTINDLVERGARFINRQRGSGTRILFDYLLEQEAIGSEQIMGYDVEEYTHLTVSAAVASKRADVGMGVAAAAQSLGLDFIPIMQERYDFVIPERFINEGLFEPIFGAMKDEQFKNRVQALPGYDVSLMGNLVLEWNPGG